MTVTRITEADASGTVAVIGSSYFQLYLEIVKLKLEKLLFLLFHDILHIKRIFTLQSSLCQNVKDLFHLPFSYLLFTIWQ